MAIATLETNGRHASPATTTESIRPGKRRRIDGQHHRVPPHPLDVKPSGNAYAAEKNSKDASGLFAQLNDEVLMQILQCWDAVGLVTVGSTCKALYAFSRAEELWKELYFR